MARDSFLCAAGTIVHAQTFNKEQEKEASGLFSQIERTINKDEALRWLQKAVDKGNVSMKPYIWYIGRKETWVDKWKNKENLD